MNCPECDAAVRLTDPKVKPQTREQFMAGVDNYVCRNGHEFVATVPLKLKDGYGIRADM